MKSGGAECLGRGWLGGRVQLFGRIAFLVAGYLLLSPACCREGLKWLRTVLEQALPAWLAEAVRSLASPGSPVGVLLGALPAAVAAAVLAGAVVCVCGLFVEWRREKTLFVLAMGIAVLAAVLVKWGEATGKAQEAGTWFWPVLHKAGVAVVACRPYVDALYAGVCLILLAGWMASLLYQWMKNGGGRATGLLGLVVAGCVLYEVLDRQGVFESRFRAERWVRPVQVLDQVFGVLDKPKDGIQLDALHPGLAGAYYLFHAMLFFFGALVVAGAVSKPLVNAILLRFMRTPDCVFWGVSPEALALARSLSEKREGGKGRRLACVFALEKAETAEKSELERSGFLWVVEGREVPSVTVRRARKHFFLAEEGSDNIAHAERLAKAAKSEPEAWVRIDDESDDSWLHRWADQAYIQKTLDVHIVRETSLAADLLLQKHPMLEASGVSCEDGTAFMEKNGETEKAAFRLLLVGFGWQGRMILNRTICDAQAPGTTFEADVVDKDDSAMDLYALRNPDAMDAYNIRPVKLDAAGRAFYGWLDGHLENWKDITRIVVTTGDDSLNLDVAMYIDRRVRELEARNGDR